MALVSISIEDFKQKEKTSSIDIVKNPNTDKLFASCGNGNTFKAQGSLDAEKRIEFLYDDAKDKGWEEGCFVNPSTDNIVITL